MPRRPLEQERFDLSECAEQRQIYTRSFAIDDVVDCSATCQATFPVACSMPKVSADDAGVLSKNSEDMDIARQKSLDVLPLSHSKN